MSDLTTARSYLDKAERSIGGAHALLALGNTEGACSRAYYAVFYAAQAALIVEGFGDEVSSIKTHTGLLGFFSRRLIKTGRLAIGFSKTLNKLHDLRLSADYLAEAPSR